jgi:hypothetical protein
VNTYNNTAGQTFQSGPYAFAEPTFADEPGSTDCQRWGNDYQHQVFTKNDCAGGSGGTAVDYQIPISTYISAISQVDANNQALADIAVNGQNYANAHGHCVVTTNISTLLIDYYTDTTADLCFYDDTPTTAERGTIVASTLNGGPLQYPNDGRDPAACFLLSSDKLAGPPVRRFGVNMAYFITQYPGIDHFTFVMRGRGASAIAVSGVYALRTVAEGYLTMAGATGSRIPGVSMAGTGAITGYTSHIVSGADGTVGNSVGSPVLQFDYVVSTNTLTVTTY